MAVRVSVPVDEELKVGIEERPDEFDLDPSLSEARRYALLVEEAARHRLARHRERERVAAYSVYAAEAAHRESVEDLFATAVEDNLI